MDDEELVAGPAGAPFVDGGAGALEGLDGVVGEGEGEGVGVCGVYSVVGAHEVEHPAKKLVLAVALLSCTSHSALQSR
jgi:hypothetical protein